MLPERITIDGLPPSANHVYLPNRGGGKRLSPEGVAWKQLVGFAVLLQRVQPPQDWRKVPCRVIVYQYMTGTRKQDTTAGAKLAEDAAMEALTGLDSKHHADGYVEDFRITREQHAAADRTVIEVSEMGSTKCTPVGEE